MIPRNIHFCWFGNGKKSDLAEYCISSWSKNLPEYKICEWNENTFPIESHSFTRAAYEQRKFAYVSDYVRAFALVNHGGIYLDIDVEIKSSLDDYLRHRAFSGFEEVPHPFTAVWGAEAHHLWPARVLDAFDNMTFDKEKMIPNTHWVSDLLVGEFGIDPMRDEYQEGKEGIAIYPSSTFCLDLPINVATHHFEGSWLPKQQFDHKYRLNRDWRVKEFGNYVREDDLGEALKVFVKTMGIKKILETLIKGFVKKYFRIG